MILVDANIPMYLVGSDHPKSPLRRRLATMRSGGGERLVTDVEVLQELLHRFTAIQRPDAIQPAFDALLNIVDETFPVDLVDVQAAKEVVFGGYRLSARDALHIAVMRRHDIDTIMIFDGGFERYPGIRRVF